MEQVWSVPFSGRPPTVVAADGYDTTVGPDGRDLAFTARHRHEQAAPPTVVVHDLRTGTSTVHAVSSSPAPSTRSRRRRRRNSGGHDHGAGARRRSRGRDLAVVSPRPQQAARDLPSRPVAGLSAGLWGCPGSPDRGGVGRLRQWDRGYQRSARAPNSVHVVDADGFAVVSTPDRAYRGCAAHAPRACWRPAATCRLRRRGPSRSTERDGTSHS